MTSRNRLGRYLWCRISVATLVGSLLIAGTAAASTENATTVAISPDGTTVYAGFNGAGFSAFSRNPSTGQLTVLGEAPTTSSGGPLEDPSIVASPDGANLYGLDSQSNQLYQYAAASGSVAEQQAYPVLTDPTVAKDPVTLAISPDGSSLYVLTYGVQFGTGIGVTSDGKINTFERNPNTGDLTLVGTTNLSSDGAVGIDPVVSPDGTSVYVGGTFPNGVAVLSRDPNTGALTIVGDQGNLNDSTAIAISADGNYLYEAGSPSSSSSASSAISVLSRNPTTGALTPAPVSQVDNGANGVSGLSDIWGLAVSPDGQCLYATSRADNSLAYFTRNAATGALTFGGVLTEGVGGVTGLADGREVTVSPDGQNVYVASPGDGGVAVFTRNPTTCAPTFVELAQDLFTLAQPTVNQANGTATLPVNVDTSGTLASSAQPAQSQSSARATADRAHLIPVTGPGTVDVPVALSGQAQQELDEFHKLSVDVAVTFTASVGSPTTKTTVIQLVTAPPTVSRLRVSPHKFSLAGRLVKRHCVAPTGHTGASKPCRRAVSLRVTYKLNVAAGVVITIARETAGRAVKGRCVAPSRRNSSRRACPRFLPVRGKITRGGSAGANRFVFNGRIGRRSLGPGTYQLIATPTGGRSTKVTFEVLA